jgi:gliding motility-associated-like protein
MIGCGQDRDRVFVRVYKKVTIPNAFSPNGDGINDTWNIQALDTYPEADVTVFNRYGSIVFNKKGYKIPWNGTYDNQPLPVGTYYYVIDLKNNTPKLSGWVLIVK